MVEPAGRSWELGLDHLGSSLSSAAIIWGNSRINHLRGPDLLHYQLPIYNLKCPAVEHAISQIEPNLFIPSYLKQLSRSGQADGSCQKAHIRRFALFSSVFVDEPEK